MNKNLFQANCYVAAISSLKLVEANYQWISTEKLYNYIMKDTGLLNQPPSPKRKWDNEIPLKGSYFSEFY